GLSGTVTAVLAAVGLPAPPPVPEARVEASGTEGVTVTTTTPPAPQPATTPRAATAAAMPTRRAARRWGDGRPGRVPATVAASWWITRSCCAGSRGIRHEWDGNRLCAGER